MGEARNGQKSAADAVSGLFARREMGFSGSSERGPKTLQDCCRSLMAACNEIDLACKHGASTRSSRRAVAGLRTRLSVILAEIDDNNARNVADLLALGRALGAYLDCAAADAGGVDILGRMVAASLVTLLGAYHGERGGGGVWRFLALGRRAVSHVRG
jgi:hypothetical protein